MGPIGQAVEFEPYTAVHLLSDWGEERTMAYVTWLTARAQKVTPIPAALPSPTAFGPIYEAASAAVTAAFNGAPDASLTFHLSPGTPAMAAVWVILGKTRFPARLIQSSRQKGVEVASLPFDISGTFLPDLLAGPDARLRDRAAAGPPATARFGDIVYGCEAMASVVTRARHAAARSIPVLIGGESGTGKELLARAIHEASPRRGKPFLPVNCGAIPEALVESTLFGYERGAFTGADRPRAGYFEDAAGGTLFLDELGELPAAAQVKLLRALNDGKITRVGSTREIHVDVRIIAATNVDLLQAARERRFREDLFYRLAVAVLKLPALRERGDDLGLLLDHCMAMVNDENRGEPGFEHKTLSDGARSILVAHRWPGNVRELVNTLRRAAIWSPAAEITTADVRDSLLSTGQDPEAGPASGPRSADFDIREVLAEVARQHVARAMADAGGNKTQAAKLLGLGSYQTLTGWLKRYGVET